MLPQVGDRSIGQTAGVPEPDAPAVRVRDLVLERGTGTARVRVTDGVDLELARGEVLGLLGPNGAGKTTLVRQVMGVVRPDAGRVELLGRLATGDSALAGRLVAYLPQSERSLDEAPVALAVEMTARLRGLGRAAARSARDAVLHELDLGGLAGRPLGRLSGGQRRLADVASVLVGERPVLVLDEPTTGLDPQARRAVWRAIERRRAQAATSVLLVTHNVLEAETVLDRVAVLDRGRVIACDTPGRLKASVDDGLRLELVWRAEAPRALPVVAALEPAAVIAGRRWSVRLPAAEARALLGELTAGPALAALDDFTLATPSLEDVYLALGGRADDLERA